MTRWPVGAGRDASSDARRQRATDRSIGDIGSVARTERSAGRPVGPAPMSEWLSDGVLLIGPDPTGAAATVAMDLPVEPGVVTVVGLLADVKDWWWLADAVAFAAPPGVAVRLAVSHAGSAREHDPAPAQQLAQRLRVEVIAPDGAVLLVPGGSAFVVAANGPTGGSMSPSEPGQWLRFNPDGTVEPIGAWFPRPAWEPATMVAKQHATGLRVLPIPAGLWICGAGPDAPAPALTDLAYCVPADPDLCSVVVGGAGGIRPDPTAVAAVVEQSAIDPGRILLVPYGSGTRGCATVARELADRWGCRVTLANGLPMIGPDGERRTLATDEDGTPLWWPLTGRLLAGSAGPPVPTDPAELLADLPLVAERVHLLREPWLVELTHFGLWLRHRDVPCAAEQVAGIPWDPRWLTVVAGVPGTSADGVRPVLAALLARLPAQARPRVRMVAPELLAQLGPARLGTDGPPPGRHVVAEMDHEP